MNTVREERELGPFPLEVSKQYRMNVVGYLKIDSGNGYKESTPYGWVEEVRVFVSEGVKLQPGDSIQAEITKVNQRSAIAKALGNYGSFIEPIMRKHPEKEFRVRLTGKSRKDARNALSEPEFEGGLFGMLTIVNNMSDERSAESLYSDSAYKECMIRLDHLGIGKNWRYFIAGRPANPDNLRSGDEIFIGEWCAHEDPELSTIRSYFYGVPSEPGIALYFRNDKSREILFKSRPMNVSSLVPRVAVRKFAGHCNPGVFRIALAREEEMEMLEQAIEKADFLHDTLEQR